jgi:hypothetical protein
VIDNESRVSDSESTDDSISTSNSLRSREDAEVLVEMGA